jgi:hypothetical protein
LSHARFALCREIATPCGLAMTEVKLVAMTEVKLVAMTEVKLVAMVPHCSLPAIHCPLFTASMN